MPRPVDVRDRLAHVLRLDLVGPYPDEEQEAEVLPEPPSSWYLTGFLAPSDAPPDIGQDPTASEELDSPGQSGDDHEDPGPEPGSRRPKAFPSSLGITVLVPPECPGLEVEAWWGDYRAISEAELADAIEAQSRGAAAKTTVTQSAAQSAAASAEGHNSGTDVEAVASEPPTVSGKTGRSRAEKDERTYWRRMQRRERVSISLPPNAVTPRPYPLAGSRGLLLLVTVRSLQHLTDHPAGDRIPVGTRAVSIFLLNGRPANPRAKEASFVFQAGLTVTAPVPFVPRPDLRGRDLEEDDERIADLQYRNSFEYAVGHGVATHAVLVGDACREARTEWVPCWEVERVDASSVSGVCLGMEALAGFETAAALQEQLVPLVTAYGDWLDRQRTQDFDHPKRQEVADELYTGITTACDRIRDGIALLEHDDVREAFQKANEAMAKQARQKRPDFYAHKAPEWRLFQLAFLLMNLRSIAEPAHGDRKIVDLIFFPTGGGKTEAYLGLAAFTLVLRRLRNPGIGSAGVSVLMRYTLRLLTLDQLGRAAALVCALELMREKDPKRLGEWPFEIGLWVGRTATPNRMGKKGVQDEHSARERTNRFRRGATKVSPIPLKSCPWCGTRFERNSFQLYPDEENPRELRVQCVGRKCDFVRGRTLPIVAVDEPIYRRLPCFLIATVDKFAAIPWTGEVGMLFGKAERYGKPGSRDEGFYGPCDDSSKGRIGDRLPQPLLPPDLIIQDELHLISGPLGTMVGLYETAVDALASRTVEGPGGRQVIGPKIVASTATVRRAQAQIRAIFGRPRVEIFPPPGPDRRDSFFAVTVPLEGPGGRPGRRYLGVAAQGRSLKVMLLRTYVTLQSAALKLYREGGHADPDNPADPYMTVLGYFNALRELGGARRIVEDEVRTRLTAYSSRRRLGELDPAFVDRAIAYEPVELTSRATTDEVSTAKDRLELPFSSPNHVDVALASNMVSVGLDIDRMGLMVVLGQPLTGAEYIQATSRVGRPTDRPGLVVTLYNVHRPRDRSHYERFEAYHASFYRAVEATSVTPFAPPAVERGLPGVVVGLVRQSLRELTAAKGAIEIVALYERLEFVADLLADRVEAHAHFSSDHERDSLRTRLRAQVKDLLDEWRKVAAAQKKVEAPLQYQQEVPTGKPLLYTSLDLERAVDPLSRKFKAERSMRGVEPTVNVWLDRDDLYAEEA